MAAVVGEGRTAGACVRKCTCCGRLGRIGERCALCDDACEGALICRVGLRAVNEAVPFGVIHEGTQIPRLTEKSQQKGDSGDGT